MKNLTQQYIFIFFMGVCTALYSCKSSSKSKTKTKNKSKTTVTKKTDPRADKVIKAARNYVGTKYKYGGMSKKGTDCSGLMCMSYKEVGVTLPRTSNQQSNFGKRIYIGELQKGDLVFFGSKPKSKKITHVGLISSVSKKSIKFIHASTKAGVVESELLSEWYRPRYIKAVRPLEK